MLTPQARRLLDRFAEVGVLSFEQLGVIGSRASVAAGAALLLPPTPVAQVRDLLVDGQDGRLPARLYHPEPGGELPLLVFFHGGGWVTGDVEGSDPACRALAVACRVAVLSVGYRLAPETPDPGPVQDCLAAYLWAREHRAELGSRDQQVVLMGDSAGGTLATGVCLRARDAGLPAPSALVLLYPPTVPPWCASFPSYEQNAVGFGLTAAGMTWFWEQYLGDRRVPSHIAAPLLAPDLSGLPPSLVVTAEHDPLRDEGAALAAALQRADSPCTHLAYDGAIHGFLSMARVLPEGEQAISDVRDFLVSSGVCQHSS